MKDILLESPKRWVGRCRVTVAFLNLNSIPAINPKIYNKAFDALIVRYFKRGLYIFNVQIFVLVRVWE